MFRVLTLDLVFVFILNSQNSHHFRSLLCSRASRGPYGGVIKFDQTMRARTWLDANSLKERSVTVDTSDDRFLTISYGKSDSLRGGGGATLGHWVQHGKDQGWMPLTAEHKAW